MCYKIWGNCFSSIIILLICHRPSLISFPFLGEVRGRYNDQRSLYKFSIQLSSKVDVASTENHLGTRISRVLGFPMIYLYIFWAISEEA